MKIKTITMKKIIIIEDEENIRETIKEILQEESYDVITAENGKIGVEKVLSCIPDMILCDIAMPVMNGYDVFHILNENQKTKQIPFIFLTAKTELTEIRKGMQMGIDDYITKPFDVNDLKQSISTRIQKAEALKLKTQKLTTRIKKQEKNNKNKENFFNNISHELRSPLNSFIGLTGIILETNLNEQQKQYSLMLKEAAENMKNLINEILDFSKLNSHKMELHPRSFNIYNSLNKLKTIFVTLSNNKNIQFYVKIDDKLPENIIADEQRIKQILLNLLSNAIKFTEKGSIILKVGLHKPHEVKSDQLKMQIIDTGRGIKERDKKEILKKYKQVGSQSGITGTGLGLVIAKELTKLMGGEMGFESTYGVGSNFWFTFDFQAGASEKNDQYKPIKVDYNILLVEDMRTNQKIISHALTKAGCKVDIANNGEEALKLFNPCDYDVILMDILMPVKDGIATTKEMQSKFSNLPPVIGLSSYDENELLEGNHKKLMNAYMSKPVNMEQLILLLKKLIPVRQHRA